MCPQYLVENFIASDPDSYKNRRPDLTLWPCIQDLRQDRTPTCTKAKFDVWNENEIKFTGAYQCFKCFLEVFLDEIGTSKKNPNHWGHFDGGQKGNGFGWDKFTLDSLGTQVGRFRVSGVASSVCTFRSPWNVCNGKTVNTPLLGVLLYAADFGDGDTYDRNAQKVIDPITGITLHGAGTDATGKILWDPAYSTQEAAKK